MSVWFEFLRCPKCGSDDISSEQPEREEGVVWYHTACMDCGFSWVEVYEFTQNEDGDCNILNEKGDVIDG